MQHVLRVALVLVAMAFSATSASAATFTEGTIGLTGFGMFNTVNAGNPVDTYTFTLSGTSTGAAGAAKLFGNANFDLVLYDSSNAVVNACGGPCQVTNTTAAAFNFSGLAAGTYTLKVTFEGSEGSSVTYAGGLALTAVPLPNSLLLFISAGGLLGLVFWYQRRRSGKIQEQAA